MTLSKLQLVLIFVTTVFVTHYTPHFFTSVREKRVHCLKVLHPPQKARLPKLGNGIDFAKTSPFGELPPPSNETVKK